MKFFTGCVAAATLALAVTAGPARVLAQVSANGIAGGAYIAVSDFDGPYGPPEVAPPPRYGYGYGYEERGPAPALLPPTEVYAVLRDNGFSPLGIPRLRGGVYTIAVIDRRGEAPVAAAKPAAPAAQQAEAPQAQPAQQTAAVQAKPAEAAPQTAAPTVGQAKPAPTIMPTQEMPAAQGLD